MSAGAVCHTSSGRAPAGTMDSMLTVLLSDDPGDAARSGAQASAAGLPAPLREVRLDDPQSLRRTPLEHWLADAFSVAPGRGLQGYARLDLGGAPDDDTLAISPVHLQATLDHLILHPPAVLSISAGEADALLDTANRHLGPDGISLHRADASLWTLHGTGWRDLDLASSAAAQGRNVDHYMPAGGDGRRARALLNELQMLWHEHPVNLQRQADGRPAVNSIWYEGQCPSLPGRPFATVLAGAPAIRGLARAGAGPVTVEDTRGLEPAALAARVRGARDDGPVLCHMAGGRADVFVAALAVTAHARDRLVVAGPSGWRESRLAGGRDLLTRIRRWLRR